MLNNTVSTTVPDVVVESKIAIETNQDFLSSPMFGISPRTEIEASVKAIYHQSVILIKVETDSGEAFVSYDYSSDSAKYWLGGSNELFTGYLNVGLDLNVSLMSPYYYFYVPKLLAQNPKMVMNKNSSKPGEELITMTVPGKGGNGPTISRELMLRVVNGQIHNVDMSMTINGNIQKLFSIQCSHFDQQFPTLPRKLKSQYYSQTPTGDIKLARAFDVQVKSLTAFPDSRTTESYSEEMQAGLHPYAQVATLTGRERQASPNFNSASYLKWGGALVLVFVLGVSVFKKMKST